VKDTSPFLSLCQQFWDGSKLSKRNSTLFFISILIHEFQSQRNMKMLMIFHEMWAHLYGICHWETK